MRNFVAFIISFVMLFSVCSFAFAEEVLPTPTPSPFPTIIPLPTPAPTPNQKQPWDLKLINEKHPISKSYKPKLKTTIQGKKVDVRIAKSLKNMINGARKAGYKMIITSSYRSAAYQQTLFNNKVNYWKKLGYILTEAINKAKTSVAEPGTSEYQYGLSVDIVSSKYRYLNAKQANQKGNKWLAKHCAEYGFIVRYPKDKQNVTGIIYEPWHFRYVGISAAKTIMNKKITLEEYLGY